MAGVERSEPPERYDLGARCSFLATRPQPPLASISQGYDQGRAGVIRLEVPVADWKWWSPREPNLYELNIEKKETAFEERKSHPVTELVTPGKTAQIAVRVYDWYGAGGLFRPVTLGTVRIGSDANVKVLSDN